MRLPVPAAVLVLALAAGCARPRPVRVGMAIPSYAHGVLWIAQDAGFFKARGLEVELFTLKGSADAMKLLLSKDLDFVLAGGDSLVKADLAGGDAVAFAGVVNTFYHRVAAGKAVRAGADLRGRRIGLPFLGGPQDMTVRAALERAGLDYEKDVRVQNLGSEFARLTAVRDGRTDAVTTDAPDSVLAGLGLHVAADVPSWKVPFPYMSAIARRETLEKRSELSLNFARALCDAMAFYRDRPADSQAILAKRLTQEPGSKTSEEELYRANGPSRFTFPPRPETDGYETVLRLGKLKKEGGPRAEDFVDARLIDRAVAEGACR